MDIIIQRFGLKVQRLNKVKQSEANFAILSQVHFAEPKQIEVKQEALNWIIERSKDSKLTVYIENHYQEMWSNQRSRKMLSAPVMCCVKLNRLRSVLEIFSGLSD